MTCWTRHGCVLVFLFHFNFIHILFLTFSSVSAWSALDIDECRDGTHQCRYNQICENTRGSYHCTCPRGYRSQGVGRPCVGTCHREIKPTQRASFAAFRSVLFPCKNVKSPLRILHHLSQHVKRLKHAKHLLRCCSLMLLIGLSASGRHSSLFVSFFTRSCLKVCRHLFVQL